MHCTVVHLVHLGERSAGANYRLPPFSIPPRISMRFVTLAAQALGL